MTTSFNAEKHFMDIIHITIKNNVFTFYCPSGKAWTVFFFNLARMDIIPFKEEKFFKDFFFLFLHRLFCKRIWNKLILMTLHKKHRERFLLLLYSFLNNKHLRTILRSIEMLPKFLDLNFFHMVHIRTMVSLGT